MLDAGSALQFAKLQTNFGSWVLLRHAPPTDRAHSFMDTTFPDCCDLIQLRTKMIQELVEQHNNVLEMLSWPPNPPDLNPIKHLLEGLEKLVHADILVPDTTANLGSGGIHASTGQGISLGGGQKGGQKNIRQVVIILWLISV